MLHLDSVVTIGQLLRWGFACGLLFLVGVAMWAVVTITRLQRESVVALAVLRTLAASAGLKEAVQLLDGQPARRHDDPPPASSPVKL